MNRLVNEDGLEREFIESFNRHYIIGQYLVVGKFESNKIVGKVTRSTEVRMT